MQTFFGSESFSKLRINREFEKLSVSLFFLRFPLRSSLHLVEAFYYCHLSFLCFRFAALRSDHIFLADLQTGPSNQSIRTASSQTTPDQIRPQIRQQQTIVRPDHHKSDHQNRPPSPRQTTKSDHLARPQTTILDYSASNQHRIPNLFNWYRSGAFFMGWVKGGI